MYDMSIKKNLLTFQKWILMIYCKVFQSRSHFIIGVLIQEVIPDFTQNLVFQSSVVGMN